MVLESQHLGDRDRLVLPGQPVQLDQPPQALERVHLTKTTEPAPEEWHLELASDLHMHTSVCKHKHMLMHTLMCTHMFMPIQTHAHAHVHTNTHAHTHVHTQCTCLRKEEREANYYSLRIYYEPRNGPSAFADLGSHHSAWCFPESFLVPILWMSTLSPISHCWFLLRSYHQLV